MVACIYWKPVKSGKCVGDTKLRDCLDKQYELRHSNKELDDTDIKYLSGLADAGVDGAEELIDAIEKHDIIEVSIEY